MIEPARRPPPGEPAVLLYQLLGLAGLGLLLVPQLARGVGLVDLLLVLTGLLGLFTRWRLAPALFLAVLAAQQVTGSLLGGFHAWSARHRLFEAADLMLCCGALAYLAAHYRLRALTSHILPLDVRRRQEGPARPRARRRPVLRQPRRPLLVTPAEVSLFLLSLPLWAVLAEVAWAWADRRGGFVGLPIGLSRFVLLAWLLGAAGLAAVALFALWRRWTMTPDEAALLLQDVLWRETRREQRRLQRWLAWSRLRGRREEAP